MELLDDVWASRDLPVLVEITRRIDEGDSPIDVSSVAEALGIDPEIGARAVHALSRRRLIDVKWFGGRENGWISNVAGEAYLLTGLHPNGDDLVHRLIEAAVQAAELIDDPEEKSRLRRFADGALGVSRDVMSGVLTAVLTRGMLGA